MRPEIKSLVDLQATDMRLAELRSRLDAFPQRLAEVEQQVSEARQRLAAAKEALKASAMDRKKYEMDVEAWKEKAKKYRDQNLSVKRNETYKALQHEIQYAESEIAQAEDRLLEKMVSGEEGDRSVKAAEQAIIAIDRAAETERQKIKAEYTVLQKELEAKQSERQVEVAAVPEKLLEVYSRVAGRRQHIGVSLVRDEACSLCGVRIRPHVFQELRREDCTDIFQCETCTRILYYVEPPPAADAASAGRPAHGAAANGSTAKED